jgi:hypothetical protein
MRNVTGEDIITGTGKVLLTRVQLFNLFRILARRKARVFGPHPDFTTGIVSPDDRKPRINWADSVMIDMRDVQPLVPALAPE